MEFHRCVGCGTEYIFRRGACSKCHSREFATEKVTEGVVVESVHLIATPDPFPDQYSIVLFKTGGGGRGFCRTSDSLEPGTEIILEGDESNMECHRK